MACMKRPLSSLVQTFLNTVESFHGFTSIYHLADYFHCEYLLKHYEDVALAAVETIEMMRLDQVKNLVWLLLSCADTYNHCLEVVSSDSDCRARGLGTLRIEREHCSYVMTTGVITSLQLTGNRQVLYSNRGSTSECNDENNTPFSTT
jgi:hypothetical protein